MLTQSQHGDALSSRHCKGRVGLFKCTSTMEPIAVTRGEVVVGTGLFDARARSAGRKRGAAEKMRHRACRAALGFKKKLHAQITIIS